MINFLKYRLVYFLISGIFIGLGMFFILTYGFRLSIDFVGGSLIEYKMNRSIDKKEIVQEFKKSAITVASITDAGQLIYSIRSPVVPAQKEKEVREAIQKNTGVKIETLRFETVGPTLGREMMIKTGVASLISIVAILIYMTFTFANFKYGAAAILAMLHDFLVVVGTYSLISKFFGAEVDTLFVVAVLTTMSFSVHDTIVVFDKIREYKRKEPFGDITDLANKALTETMVRSLNNSLTIALMLCSLLLLGGDTIRFFVATLLVGTITGTYSSPFIAVPILVMLENKK